MENFRKNMLSCTEKMKNISLMRGQSSEVDAEARNRNTFFDSFLKFSSMMNSLHFTKCFDGFNLTDEAKELLRNCWEIMDNTF